MGLLKGSLMVAVLLVGMTSFAPTSKWLAGFSFSAVFPGGRTGRIWVAPSDLRARFYQGLDMLHRGRAVSATCCRASSEPTAISTIAVAAC